VGRCKDTQANREFLIVAAAFIVIIIYLNLPIIEFSFYLVRYCFFSFANLFLIIVLSIYFFSVVKTIGLVIKEKRERIEEEKRIEERNRKPDSPRETHEEYLARMAEVTRKSQEKLAKEYKENREEREEKRREIEMKQNEEWDKQEILRRLDKMGAVYLKEDLTKKEIKVLVENDFRQVNEYDLIEKKRIPVFVKPFHHHSIAHTFLVWSARRLIESFGIEDVREYFTVDADLVFSWKGEEYAIEVECGSLIGKKNQLKEKVGNLNKKYPGRWMFIVSHRDLLKKYKKFGKTVTRSKVREKLKKMLKSAHPKR
jgi:F0F1-type ATP synthase membrane subunit b/b'